jgi:hypothetical protein
MIPLAVKSHQRTLQAIAAKQGNIAWADIESLFNLETALDLVP